MQITAVLHFSNFHYIWILLINLATKKRLLLVRKVIRSLEGFGWPLFLSDKHYLMLQDWVEIRSLVEKGFQPSNLLDRRQILRHFPGSWRQLDMMTVSWPDRDTSAKIAFLVQPPQAMEPTFSKGLFSTQNAPFLSFLSLFRIFQNKEHSKTYISNVDAWNIKFVAKKVQIKSPWLC